MGSTKSFWAAPPAGRTTALSSASVSRRVKPNGSISSGKAKDARCFSTAQNTTPRIDRRQNGGSPECIGILLRFLLCIDPQCPEMLKKLRIKGAFRYKFRLCRKTFACFLRLVIDQQGWRGHYSEWIEMVCKSSHKDAHCLRSQRFPYARNCQHRSGARHGNRRRHVMRDEFLGLIIAIVAC